MNSDFYEQICNKKVYISNKKDDGQQIVFDSSFKDFRMFFILWMLYKIIIREWRNLNKYLSVETFLISDFDYWIWLVWRNISWCLHMKHREYACI